MKKDLPIAMETFPDLIRKGCYYVDKTPFIKEVMTAGKKVRLITRPRRFGKTLFMDTLKSFLQLDWNHPHDTASHEKLFAGLKILTDQDFCRQHMGQYPVVSLTLKDIEGRDYANAYALFAALLESKAAPYRFLLESPRLDDFDKNALRKYLTPDYLKDRAHEADAKSFLKTLTICLSKHYESQVVLLIDEYDVPLAKAAQFGYYPEMLELIRSFLGQILKEPLQDKFDASAYVRKAVLTGCLRVGKESVFTDINNFDVNTVCSDDQTLSSVIGFSTEEVKALLDYYELSSRFDDVKHWYDGYRFAGQDIYCPWDVINFSDKAIASQRPAQYRPQNYWEGTSGNEVIEEFLGFLTSEDAEKMQTLVDGGTIEVAVNEKLTYSDFAYHNSDDFWTLLLFTGYLTVTALCNAPSTYQVKIPNEEIRDTFEKKVRALYSKKNRLFAHHGENLAEAFLSGESDDVRKVLLPLLRRYVSVRDEATKAPPENYYHGFLSAMLICAGDKASNLYSNSEAGDGFADLVFTSEDLDTGVVIEIKRCSKPEEMPSSAESAVQQIKDRHYAQAFDGYQCARILGFGIAFCRKLCVVKAESLTP